MNKILVDRDGKRVVSEPGALIGGIDKATAAARPGVADVPLDPRTASIGGFVAGGSGGVGSIKWGGLRDFGNVLAAASVLTMEA